VYAQAEESLSNRLDSEMRVQAHRVLD